VAAAGRQGNRCSPGPLRPKAATLLPARCSFPVSNAAAIQVTFLPPRTIRRTAQVIPAGARHRERPPGAGERICNPKKQRLLARSLDERQAPAARHGPTTFGFAIGWGTGANHYSTGYGLEPRPQLSTSMSISGLLRSTISSAPIFGIQRRPRSSAAIATRCPRPTS